MGGADQHFHTMSFHLEHRRNCKRKAKKQLPLICSTWMTKELSIPATPRHWLRRLIKITPDTIFHTTTTATIPRSKLKKTLSSRYEVPGAMLNAENINMSQVSPRSFDQILFWQRFAKKKLHFQTVPGFPQLPGGVPGLNIYFVVRYFFLQVFCGKSCLYSVFCNKDHCYSERIDEMMMML